MSECAACKRFVCMIGDVGHAPDNCPMPTALGTLPDVLDRYKEPENQRLARISAEVERDAHHGRWCRIEEIIEFARRIGARKLGLAFCRGFRGEAKVFNDLLNHHGFQVVSVMCKTGAIPKEEAIGFREDEKIFPGKFEPICNPIAQAEMMNQEGTQLNVIMGLCVGHDSLFIKNSDALVTYAVVKDRVLANNPAGALYQAQGYYRKQLWDDHVPPEREEQKQKAAG